jgi:hypothetical protein
MLVRKNEEFSRLVWAKLDHAGGVMRASVPQVGGEKCRSQNNVAVLAVLAALQKSSGNLRLLRPPQDRQVAALDSRFESKRPCATLATVNGRGWSVGSRSRFFGRC